MLSQPTDLSAAEEHVARSRLDELADRFMADGTVCSPTWAKVFRRTWRHPYVPSYYPDIDKPSVLCVDPHRREEWLHAVYSDLTLITKIMPVPLSRALRPATGYVYTSSSTLPSLVLSMLERLDITDDSRVLEIGTGTGYNAALLCERLGSRLVTSIDIDPELVDLAGERLAGNGYTPTLATADGAAGHPPRAPYDRIISTCAVRSIPNAWLDQTAPGAVILTDVHGALGGTLVQLTVDTPGTATGRFVPHWAGFMRMRSDVEPAHQQHPWIDDDPVRSVTTVDPTTLVTHGVLGFVAQWHLPDVTHGRTHDDGGGPVVFLLAPDGSRAEVSTTPTADGYPVRQYGPRQLWDVVEQAARFWDDAGWPNYDQFGITATATSKYVWYEHPGSTHRWPLPF